MTQDNLFADITDAPVIAIDLETKDPNLKDRGPGAARGDGFVTGVAIAVHGASWYYPIRHASGNLDEAQVWAYVQDILKRSKLTIGANYMYDMKWMHRNGMRFNCITGCIQRNEALINEEAKSFKLETLGMKYVGVGKDDSEMREQAEILKCDPSAVITRMDELPAWAVEKYARQDAALTLAVWNAQMPELERQELIPIFNLENDLAKVLLDTMMKGVRVDVEKAKELNEVLKKEEDVLQHELNKLAGEEVDPWSGIAISGLCDKLGIKYNMTEKDNPSFESSWLENHEHPFCQSLYKLRSHQKSRRDFLEGTIIDQSHNGRIYAQFHQTNSEYGGTVSGRLSSSNPNLQQQPSRNPYWKKIIRSLYLPEPGERLLRCDYSQQEPRLAVHYANARGMRSARSLVEAYNSNPRSDAHQMVADMAGVSRTAAKGIFLGSIYGMGKKKLMAQLGSDFKTAQTLYYNIHNAFPFIDELSKEAKRYAEQRKYVRTILGRRRHFNGIVPVKTREEWNEGVWHKPVFSMEEAKEKWPGRVYEVFGSYKALNSIIQGSAADMTKKATLDIAKALNGKAPLLQVHDELVYSISSDVEARTIVNLMETAIPLNVPVVVDPEIGPSWGECEKVCLS